MDHSSVGLIVCGLSCASPPAVTFGGGLRQPVPAGRALRARRAAGVGVGLRASHQQRHGARERVLVWNAQCKTFRDSVSVLVEIHSLLDKGFLQVSPNIVASLDLIGGSAGWKIMSASLECRGGSTVWCTLGTLMSRLSAILLAADVFW